MFFTILISCITIILMVGCTDRGGDGSPTNENESGASDETTSKGPDDQDSNKKEKSLPKQIEVEYLLEGMKEIKTATLYESDNQPFYMYILSDFSATAEEPGSDIVFYQISDKNFMRVQVLPEEVKVDEVEQSVKEWLTNIGPPKKMNVGEQNTLYDVLRNAEIAYYATGDKVSARIIVLKVDGKFIKFTIHTVLEWESISPFLKMIELTGVR